MPTSPRGRSMAELGDQEDDLPTAIDHEPYHSGEDAGDEAATRRLPALDEDPAERLRSAERRLASLLRRTSLEEAELHSLVVREMVRLRDAETSLAPLYERLGTMLQRTAARLPEVRARVVAFAKIDGALAAYQALLAMIEPA